MVTTQIKSGNISPAKAQAWLLDLAKQIGACEHINGSAEVTETETNLCMRIDGAVLSFNLMNLAQS